MAEKPAAAKKKKAAAKPDENHGDKPGVQASEPPQSDAALKKAILKEALKDAAFDGFTDGALAKAAKKIDTDKTEVDRLFPEGALSLIEYFSSSVDDAMEEKLKALDISKRKIRERIKLAVLTRLALLAPNKEAARRAAATMTLPMHAARGATMMYRTVDSMWRAAGDTATDLNFYTKRGILAGVYGSVLVRWFNDTGEDETATEAFLDARIENVMQFEKFKAKAKEAFSKFPDFTAWGKSK
jgi:ubiquinone biosynthesis protein COQ9